MQFWNSADVPFWIKFIIGFAFNYFGTKKACDESKRKYRDLDTGNLTWYSFSGYNLQDSSPHHHHNFDHKDVCTSDWIYQKRWGFRGSVSFPFYQKRCWKKMLLEWRDIHVVVSHYFIQTMAGQNSFVLHYSFLFGFILKYFSPPRRCHIHRPFIEPKYNFFFSLSRQIRKKVMFLPVVQLEKYFFVLPFLQSTSFFVP